VATSIPVRKTHRSETEVPDLELDLSPLEVYIRAMIDQVMNQRVSSNEDLKEFIREVVREELASRLKPLFEMA